MKTIKAIILAGHGLNCERETALAFERAGAKAKIFPINELIEQRKKLASFQILTIPGGFSYGDHLSSGKMMANKITFYLLDEFQRFISSGKPVLGICNGFQILVKTGLLPNLSQKNQQEATLMDNDSHEFINKWVYLAKNPANKSFWLNGLEKLSQHLPLPIRHGEGRFFTNKKNLNEIMKRNLFALTYHKSDQSAFSGNPNGSLRDIAGLTNAEGNVLGLMPHPEAFMFKSLAPFILQKEMKKQYSYFPNLKKEDGLGMIFFRNVVDFLKKN